MGNCKVLPDGWTAAEELLGNYPESAATLRPYECVVLKSKPQNPKSKAASPYLHCK